jgi:hypothetical protein
MTERRLERLDPDIAVLLRKAAPYPEAPAAARMRVRDALQIRIADAATSGLESSRGDEGTAATPPQPAGGLFSLAPKPILTLIATFVVGASAGAAMHAGFRAPRDRIIYVERPSVAPTPAPPIIDFTAAASAPPEPPPSPAVESPPSTLRALTDNRAASSSSDLGAEQALLDVARTAFAEGRGHEALGPLDRHAQRYPKGILAEEREALAVNVLVTLGRYDDARARSSRFLRRYPGSLLRASVEAAIDAIP